jgi:hypothetical protein
MKRSQFVTALVLTGALGLAGAAWAGAPQPDTRAGDFKHVCQGGANKGNTCTVATEATDCPKSSCVVVTTTKKTVKGKLTLIADDLVVDWATGVGSPRALTVLLEVKANGAKQLLAETYQNLTDPTQPPTAPPNVISIPIDESALKTLAGDLSGLMFVQPQATLANQLQTLFSTTGTPVIIAVKKKSQLSDHTGDDLATVLRFSVKIEFVEPQ